MIPVSNDGLTSPSLLLKSGTFADTVCDDKGNSLNDTVGDTFSEEDGTKSGDEENGTSDDTVAD